MQMMRIKYGSLAVGLVLLALGCSGQVTEAPPVGRYALTMVDGVAVPTSVTSTSPEIVTSGTLVLEAQRYELTILVRPKEDPAATPEARVARGRVSRAPADAEFLLTPDSPAGPIFDTFLLERQADGRQVRLLGNLASRLDFERTS